MNGMVFIICVSSKQIYVVKENNIVLLLGIGVEVYNNNTEGLKICIQNVRFVGSQRRADVYE